MKDGYENERRLFDEVAVLREENARLRRYVATLEQERNQEAYRRMIRQRDETGAMPVGWD